jgi:2-phospho-L-lactate transferase/gluconeogenesis factor (CofD/UPF0052 family)
MSVSGEPAVPDGLRIEQIRVYYLGSGDVVHVHQLVSAPGEELDSQRVEDEMKIFEEAVRQRYGDVEYLVVEATDLQTSGESIKVDVEQRRLVRAETSR